MKMSQKIIKVFLEKDQIFLRAVPCTPTATYG